MPRSGASPPSQRLPSEVYGDITQWIESYTVIAKILRDVAAHPDEPK